MMMWASEHPVLWLVCLLLSLLLAPLPSGIINKVKAFFAGRHGQPVLQLYFDLAKLVRKSFLVSRTSGGVFALAPCVSLIVLLLAAALLPFGATASPFGFSGDVFLFFYWIGLARMATVLAALDTGSSFEGMGASREMQFSALTEAVIFACIGFLASLARGTESLLPALGTATQWSGLHATSLLLTAAAFFVVLLMENCRVPFDDPETHLELTMIHEAMILDYAGPDLALVLYGAALKFWLFASFFVLLLLPEIPGSPYLTALCYFGGVFLTAVAVGAVESSMARYRFLKVPKMLVGALGMALLGIFFLLIFEGGLK